MATLYPLRETFYIAVDGDLEPAYEEFQIVSQPIATYVYVPPTTGTGVGVGVTTGVTPITGDGVDWTGDGTDVDGVTGVDTVTISTTGVYTPTTDSPEFGDDGVDDDDDDDDCTCDGDTEGAADATCGCSEDDDDDDDDDDDGDDDDGDDGE